MVHLRTGPIDIKRQILRALVVELLLVIVLVAGKYILATLVSAAGIWVLVEATPSAGIASIAVEATTAAVVALITTASRSLPRRLLLGGSRFLPCGLEAYTLGRSGIVWIPSPIPRGLLAGLLLIPS